MSERVAGMSDLLTLIDRDPRADRKYITHRVDPDGYGLIVPVLNWVDDRPVHRCRVYASQLGTPSPLLFDLDIADHDFQRLVLAETLLPE